MKHCVALFWVACLVHFEANLIASGQVITDDEVQLDPIDELGVDNFTDTEVQRDTFIPQIGTANHDPLMNPWLGMQYGAYPMMCPLLDLFGRSLLYGGAFGYGGLHPGLYGPFGSSNYGMYPGAFQGGYSPFSTPPYYWNQSPVLALQRQLLDTFSPSYFPGIGTRDIHPSFSGRSKSFKPIPHYGQSGRLHNGRYGGGGYNRQYSDGLSGLTNRAKRGLNGYSRRYGSDTRTIF